MLVTLLGMMMLVKLVQSRNAKSAMVVTPLGMMMLVKLAHPRNALSPMVVTLLGIVMEPLLPNGYWMRVV